MTWMDWSGYLRDLAGISCLATILAYLCKLARPGRYPDRLAGIALTMAFLASGGALWGGLASGSVPAWALFVWPLLSIFWLLETEFGTRILGMVAGSLGLVGERLFPWGVAVSGPNEAWRMLTDAGAILTGAFEVFALGTWVLVLLYRASPALSSRKTARFFTINGLIISDLSYRLNGWALPFVGFAMATALIGLVAGEVSAGALSLLVGAGAASGIYAVASRQQARPVWLLLGTGALLACYGTLGLLHGS